MAWSTVTDCLGMLAGHNDNVNTPVKSSSPQLYNHSESKYVDFAAHLPCVNGRKSPEKDARDVVTDSDSDQQKQQQHFFLSPTSCSFVHDPDKEDSFPPQQTRHEMESFEQASPADPLGHRGNQGIKAAKQRVLREKATKMQTKTESVTLRAEKQASQTSSESSAPLSNRSVASNSSSRMSSTLQISVRPKTLHQPIISLPPQSRYAKVSKSSTPVNNGEHIQSCSYGRLDSAFQRPQLPLSNHTSQPPSSITSRDYCVRNEWANGKFLSITVWDLPENITTRELWATFKHEGHISHIRLYENALGSRDGKALVKFSPPPATAFWERRRYPIQLTGGRTIPARIHAETFRRAKDAETMTMYADSVDFGTMVDQKTMMNMRTVLPRGDVGIKLCMNMFHKEISVEFPVHIVNPQAASNDPNLQRCKHDRTELFQFRIPFSRLKVVQQIANQGPELILLISLETPPKFFKQLDPFNSHDDKALVWGDNEAWYRQTDIVHVPSSLKKSSLTWKKTDPTIDLGCWTTYRLVFNISEDNSAQFDLMREAFRDHNIEIVPSSSFHMIKGCDAPVWKFINLPVKDRSNTGTGLEEMIHANKPQMAFEVRYQLEVCLSQGYLNEHNLSEGFITTLLNMNVQKARDFLEYIANHGTRIYDPMLLIQAMDWRGSLSRTKIPSYCAYVRSATVTPTTVYFQTPVAETSNRVIRQYPQYADRFLRVRFTEEKSEGKIYPTTKDTMNEVFTRIKRVLTNGIRIGDRTYEFLACGNSQFREHGAYFFAPLPNMTTEKIRTWMGMFRDIKTVALYASRLGQCFSTTRAIHGARAFLVEIPDITRNGFNFTDGVGRISPFLAHLAASELGILQHSQEPPSVFQIRVGGCKGVLAVCPDSLRRDIHIRNSQYKFPAKHEGLEIIRWSQYAVANLNRQLILILSALGVPDQVFAQKLQTQLSQLERAMTDETTALAVLQKEIDHNQMTLTIASMILDGFQKTGEPFLTSLLHLWRAWSIKYLKEKARITIGAGALLLGCVDETATLQGHFNDTPSPPIDASNDEKAKYVPQVFVRISKNSDGRPEVMLGPMLLARNPSLHPGDVRVVCGVDVPQLHHLKDVIVLPQTGDRDVAGMCSGGDLDGDDFLVIWDQDLLPTEWNHGPMDYSRPPMEKPNENIGIDDLTTFFVTYMKNDTLPSIAQAHTANADYLEDGVKDVKCLKLANLHSMAVDYVKTGQPAYMSRDLKPLKWPHFMEKIGQQRQTYTSKKVLGQLYDQVERIDFVPAFTAPFDMRILQAYTLDENILQNARDIKEEYDVHMRRIMAQQEIKTEFEVWSTFVLQHTSTVNNFKYHEQIGEISMALKDQFRLICYERAGGKDFEHIGPFAAAMYEVTAMEVTAAVKECHCTQVIGGQPKPLREMTPSAMPLMTFPWLFQDILGRIAKTNSSETLDILSVQEETGLEVSVQPDLVMPAQHKRGHFDSDTLSSEDYLKTSEGITRPGELLELFGDSSDFRDYNGPTAMEYVPSSSTSVKSNSSIGTSARHGFAANDKLSKHPSSNSLGLPARKSNHDSSHDTKTEAKKSPRSATRSVSESLVPEISLQNQGRTEAVRLDGDGKISAFDLVVQQFYGDDKAFGVAPEYAVPEGSNLRLLNDLMMDLSARSDESGDLVSKSFHNEVEEGLEDLSLLEEKAAKTVWLSKTNDSAEMGGDADTLMITEEEKNPNADEIGYSSGSDTKSEEVDLRIDDSARPLDQLAKFIEDDCVSVSRE